MSFEFLQILLIDGAESIELTALKPFFVGCCHHANCVPRISLNF